MRDCLFNPLFFRNKYLLLNSQELNELSAISMKANIPEVEALVNTDRSLVCDGKKGLLTRILTVMKREPPDSSFRWVVPRWVAQLYKCIKICLVHSCCFFFLCGCRFWQARAVESFLRGATSYADQMFLLKRGLLEVKPRQPPVGPPEVSKVVAADLLLPSLRSTSCSASSTVAARLVTSSRATLTCSESS